MKKPLFSLIVLSLFGGLCLVGNSWSQEPLPGNKPAPKVEVRPVDPARPESELNEPRPSTSRVTAPTYFPTRVLLTPDGHTGVYSPPTRPDGAYYAEQPVFVAPVPPKILQLMDQLREANDDAKKADLTKQLETIMVTNFDEDMKSRETELKKLEDRVTKLRNQLNRRKEAKAEIIQLLIKVMVNEAEGLGFSGVSRPDILPLPQSRDDLFRKGVLPESLPAPVLRP